MNPILEEIRPGNRPMTRSVRQGEGEVYRRVCKKPATPENGKSEESLETIGELLARKGLLGIVDSSEPDDSTSPSHRPLLYDMIAA